MLVRRNTMDNTKKVGYYQCGEQIDVLRVPEIY
jgi:hypothetical protein